MTLRDRDRPTYCGRYASVSAAFVARWGLGANGCNKMIGLGALGPLACPGSGASAPLSLPNQRDHGADVK
jgi:hypothetical protein